ncbi:MAG: RNA degradosome polyphosphate kinase [Lentisphaerae bacterium GWF2_57_35]|nr:MAG: RNA degradosome polyphosphate kinase [Lentisphaerae bacterium GWF2_57_35]
MPKTPFINRELSWLAFNRRVLEESLDPALPLLERVKFLAIVSSNLDEFFMVRVGGLQLLLEQGKETPDPSGLTPAEQLVEISRQAHQMVEDQYGCFLKDLEPRLAEAGIRRLAMSELVAQQDMYLQLMFEHEVFPVVTPMSIDLDDPFPLLSGLGINLFVRLQNPRETDQAPRFAVIAVPKGLPRFITVPTDTGYHYVLLENLIEANVNQLFPGEPIAECVPFRITRNADMSVREDLAGDLLDKMREVLTERKLSTCVRLEVSHRVSATTLSYIKTMLHLHDEDIYPTPGPLDMAAYFRLASMSGFENLKLEPWPPQAPPDTQEGVSLFEIVSRQDLLLCHPFDSFDPIIRLIEEAADDPHVLAIKQILYRTSDNSPIVAALARAADRGKHVTVLVELKARFDEARNIEWATALEHAGVQVIYGLKGLKTHAKICIIVRREPSGVRRYLHFGTGNYNERTARLYTDISYMTCNEDYGVDASAFFNTITGYSQPVKYRKLEAAPAGLRERVLELIENEIQRKTQGQEARIMAKMNSLADPALIEALYRASQAGVPIQLNVRGICCLCPGVPGVSENIAVVSIVDRFLEHSRILYFHNGGDPLVFISSADWMPRNLDRRVELLIPVEDPASSRRLIDILETCLKDTSKARRLQADGAYVRVKPTGKRKALRSQETMYLHAREASKAAQKAALNTLEPERPDNGKS